MKFSEIARGTRSDCEIELPRYDGQGDDAEPIRAPVRALNGIEEGMALSAARRHAIAEGVDAPATGEPIYDLALMVETIAIAVLDPESAKDARTPLFDGGPKQIRKWYGREAIALIYELQQDYQNRVAPTFAKLTPFEFFDGLETLGGEDEEKARRFFYRCRPGLRWIYMRSTAVQQRNAPSPKSADGSPSERSTTPRKSERKKPARRGGTHTHKTTT